MPEGNAQSHRARLARRVFVSGAVVLAAAVAFVLVRRATRPGPVAPGFALRDQNNQPTTLAQFRGKVVVLTFIDPECQQICPLTTQSMLRAVDALGPKAAQNVQLLGINVNLAKATPADLAEYTRIHGLQGRWRFLTGTPAQLKKVWSDYDVHVQVVDGDVQHEAVMVVIDPDGYERFLYATPMSYAAVGDQAHTLEQGIAKLLPADLLTSKPVSEPSAAPANAPGQNDTLQLSSIDSASSGMKAAAPAPVQLGGPHAHLVLFFANWLGTPQQIAANLKPLDSYGKLAKLRGWPSPVAADVLTTEPSIAKAKAQLADLAADLKTPIVADATGELADDYHVGDLPWYVLTSAGGNILWRHDGWVSAAELKQDVTAAMAGSPDTSGH